MIFWPYSRFILNSPCKDEEIEKKFDEICSAKARYGKYNAKKTPAGYSLSRVAYLDRSLPRKLMIFSGPDFPQGEISVIITYHPISILMVLGMFFLPLAFAFEMGICLFGFWTGCSSPDKGLLFASFFILLLYIVLVVDFNRGIYFDRKYLNELLDIKKQ